MEAFLRWLSKITLKGCTKVNGDIYYFLACLNCMEATNLRKVRAVCTRKNCVIVRKLRRTDIFIGPSPLALHATISKHKISGERTLEALKTFRRLLCEEFGRYLELYGVQMFPCLRCHELRDLNHVDSYVQCS